MLGEAVSLSQMVKRHLSSWIDSGIENWRRRFTMMSVPDMGLQSPGSSPFGP